MNSMITLTHKIHRILFYTLIVWMGFLHFTAHASANICDEKSTEKSKGHFKTNGATDPCAEYQVSKTAATRQYVATGVHAAVATVCFVQASYPAATATQACQTSDRVGVGADIVGAVVISNKAEEVMGVLQNTATGALSKAVIGGGLGSGGTNKTSKSSGDKAENDKKGAQLTACKNAFQTYSNLNGAKQAKESSEQALQKKAELFQADEDSKLNGNKPTTLSDFSGSDSTSNPISLADIKESAAMAGMAPLFNEFQKVTGGRPISELFERIHRGEDPMVAAGEMARGSIGEENLAQFANLGKAAKEIAARNNESGASSYASSGNASGSDLENNNSTSNIAANEDSTENAHSPTSKNADNSTDNSTDMFKDLLAKFMPGQTDAAEKAKAKNITGLAFQNSRTVASLEEGIHPIGRSIFEIVDSRYRIIEGRFLTGENFGAMSSTAQKTSLVPKNIYLKK